MPATIKLGSSGADVRRWQELLGAAGFPVALTAVFDASTDSLTKAWQKAKGLVVDGIVGPASWAAMTGQPAPAGAGGGGDAAAHRFGREVLKSVWLSVTGEQPTLAALQIAGAQAHLESGYGRASYTNKLTGERASLNNWGAVQSGKPPCGPDGFEATDTHADGSPYQWCYRRYATPEDGARHMLAHLTVKRPSSWEHMRRGDIDAWAAQMRQRDPITGTGLYFEQSVEGRAKGIEMRVNAIAAAHGEPVAAKRGGAPIAIVPSIVTGGAVGAVSLGAIAALVYYVWRYLRG